MSKLKKNIKEVLFFFFDLAGFFLSKETPIDKRAIKKILLVEGGGIGDLLMIFPVIASLKDNFPGAAIDLLAAPGSQGILALFPEREVLSQVIDYDIKGKQKSFSKKMALIRYLRRKKYDLVFSPSRGEGMRELSIMNFLAGIPRRMGFSQGRTGWTNTIRVEFARDVSILRQNLALVSQGKLIPAREEINISIPGESLKRAKELLKESGFDFKVTTVAFHTGASWNPRYKCWPLEQYIALIKMLLKEKNVQIVLVGSPGEVDNGALLVKNIPHSSIINMIGKTSIDEMAAVISLCHLFIGNDSGPLHIALALKIPAVAVFGGTSPDQIVAYREKFTAIRKDLPCSPCYLHQIRLSECPYDFRCMKELSADEVMTAVRTVFSEKPCC